MAARRRKPGYLGNPAAAPNCNFKSRPHAKNADKFNDCADSVDFAAERMVPAMRLDRGSISVVLLSVILLNARAAAQPAAEERPIDLASALRLAGVDNPQIRLARERVREAVALRQLAAAQFLPDLNMGGNFDHHLGPLQQSSGQILKVDRDSLYMGLGAGAVSAGTVPIPGIMWSANVSDVWFGNLVSKQIVRQRGFDSEAVKNDTLLRVASAYLELLRAVGKQAAAQLTRDEAREVARVTKDFAKTGKGRQSDADRAATEYEQRQADVAQAEGDVQIASARLCQLLRLDPAFRLTPMEQHIAPSSLVPEPIPLAELLAIAITQRPELRAHQAAIRAALLELRHQKLLPFSPTVLVGYSWGDFGGGSNLIAETGAQPRFGTFGNREDLDVMMYWSARNLGVGNLASIRFSKSQLRQSELRELETLDRIRAEVAAAQARVLARFAQIEPYEKAIQSSQAAYKQDLQRIVNGEGLPIELEKSLSLLGRSRFAYLDAIVDYNRAQFELYVALGQPPADTLARPVPSMSGAPAPIPEKK